MRSHSSVNHTKVITKSKFDKNPSKKIIAYPVKGLSHGSEILQDLQNSAIKNKQPVKAGAYASSRTS